MARATPMPPDERRAAIIEATAPLLRERGREVSTREIAEAAGIAEGTIFRVFSSKEEIIDAVLDDAFDPTASYRALQAIDPDLDLERRVSEAIAILQQRMNSTFSLIYRLGFPKPGEGARRHKHRVPDRALEISVLAKVFAPDRDRLRISPERAASTLGGFVLAMSHPMLRGGAPDHGEQARDATRDEAPDTDVADPPSPVGPEPPPDPRQIADLFLHGVTTTNACPHTEGA